MFPFGGWGGPEKDRVLWTNDASLDRLQASAFLFFPPTLLLSPSTFLFPPPASIFLRSSSWILNCSSCFAEFFYLVLNVELSNIVKNAQAAHTITYCGDDVFLFSGLRIEVDSLVAPRQHNVGRFHDTEVEVIVS